MIQPPKTKPAETQKEETESAKETKETAEEGYQYVYVKDENGERVRKKIKMETNADGEYVKWETDADGYLTDERAPSQTLDPAETDENGNPKETTGRDWIRPTETDADGNIIYPTDADGNYITNPNETARPGESSSGSGVLRPESLPPEMVHQFVQERLLLEMALQFAQERQPPAMERRPAREEAVPVLRRQGLSDRQRRKARLDPDLEM